MKKLELKEFDFNLPLQLIAQNPLKDKENAKLLTVEQDNLKDLHIRDLPSLLQKGDILVLNDTKVIPARIIGKKNNATVEITLHYKKSYSNWLVFIKNSKRVKEDEVIIFASDFAAKIIAKLEGGVTEIEFFNPLTNSLITENLWQYLDKNGVMPLPPYIKRNTLNTGQYDLDKTNYQTIFAKNEGAVAAPTAGLHFTSDLIDTLQKQGVNIQYVTLHVGAGTFLPVKVENVFEHKMHKEYAYVSSTTAQVINQAKKNNKRIISVGTTPLRTLEYIYQKYGTIVEFSGEIDLFILPSFKFNVIDCLLTNFHLPKSTLFMLISAFCGLTTMRNAYKHAIESNYRFFSYGDATFLYKKDS